MQGRVGSLGGLARAASGKLAAAAGMLVATAAIVVAAGGTGLLGPLGGLITGERASEGAVQAAGTGRRESPDDPIVAAVLPARGAPGAGLSPRPRRGGGDGDRGRPQTPPLTPAPPAGAPAPPAGAVTPPSARPPEPPPPPPSQSRVVDRVDAAVDQAAAQAPDPARPGLEPVQRITEALKQTCGTLPVCP